MTLRMSTMSRRISSRASFSSFVLVLLVLLSLRALFILLPFFPSPLSLPLSSSFASYYLSFGAIFIYLVLQYDYPLRNASSHSLFCLF